MIPTSASNRLQEPHDAGVSIRLDTLSRELLEREGVRSFCDSYHELIACIETKLELPTSAVEARR